MRGYKIYFAFGVVMILIYLVAQFNKPIPTDWSASYLKKDKIALLNDKTDFSVLDIEKVYLKKILIK